MSITFNCSFPRNTTVETACCEPGKKEFPDPIQFSPDNKTAYCTTTNGSLLNECLSERHSVYSQACVIQDVKSDLTIVHSTSPRRRGLSTVALLLLGLTLLGGVLGAPTDSTTCEEFTPAGRDTWSPGESDVIQISDVSTCKGTTSPCGVRPMFQPKWEVKWDVPSGIDVKVKPEVVVDAAGKDNHAAEVEFPAIYDKLYVPPSTNGYYGASVITLVIPGTLKCSDGKEYKGSAAVPRFNVFNTTVVPVTGDDYHNVKETTIPQPHGSR